MKKLLFSAALFFLYNLAYAQVITIAGTIVDTHTKEPISFASVSFNQLGNGKVTDSAGKFTFNIKLKAKKDTLTISFIGYQTLQVEITDSLNDKPLLLEMQRGKTGNEVTVRTKVSKGLFLWKKIVSKKKQYDRYNLPNFSYQAYNKLEVDLKNFNADKAKKNFILKPFSFIFDNVDSTSEKEPFLPAYLLESISDYKYQRQPKKYFEQIKASNTKGFANESISKLMGVMNQNVNVYGNYVNVMDKDFIGPFNDNADVYYNFHVTDTQKLGDKRIYRFTFSPKHAGQNTFEGDAWVFGGTWQIQKINLYLGSEANINYIDRLSIFQEFVPMSDSIYFLKRDKFFADFKVLGKQSLTFIGRKTTSYHNIEISSDSCTSFFAKQTQQEVIETLPNVNKHSDSTWEVMRHPDSLSVNEKAIYSTVDKLLKMPKFQKLQNTLKFLGTGYKNTGNYEIGPWFNWISSNVWEGMRLRFDLGTNTGFNKHIYLHTYLAYGFTDKKIKGKAEAFWILKREPKRLRLHASYSNDIDNGISQYGDVSQDNLFSLAIRKPAARTSFISVNDLRFEVFNEIGKGISTEWFAAHKSYRPLRNLPYADSFPVAKGSALTSFELALKLRWAYGEQFVEGDYFRYSLGTKYPVVEATFTKSIPNFFGSAYDYTKIHASIKDYIRISPLGSLSYKVYAGKVYGSLPFTFLEIHPGNNLYYYSSSSFNLMRRFEYISDKYAGANIEHNVGSGLFRFVPITRKMKLRQFWNAKVLWGSLSAANNKLNGAYFKSLNGSTYAEVGTGIDNIFKVLRLDFVWRLAPTPLPTDKVSRFGVFGSFSFQF